MLMGNFRSELCLFRFCFQRLDRALVPVHLRGRLLRKPQHQHQRAQGIRSGQIYLAAVLERNQFSPRSGCLLCEGESSLPSIVFLFRRLIDWFVVYSIDKMIHLFIHHLSTDPYMFPLIDWLIDWFSECFKLYFLFFLEFSKNSNWFFLKTSTYLTREWRFLLPF